MQEAADQTILQLSHILKFSVGSVVAGWPVVCGVYAGL